MTMNQINKKRVTVLTALTILMSVVIIMCYPHVKSSMYRYEVGKPWNYSQLIAPFDLIVPPDSAMVHDSLAAFERNYVPYYVHKTVNVDSLHKAMVNILDQNRRVTEMLFSGGRKDFYRALRDTLTLCYRTGVMPDSLALPTSPDKINLRNQSNRAYRETSVDRFYSVRDVIAKVRQLAAKSGYGSDVESSGVLGDIVPSLAYEQDYNNKIITAERRRLMSSSDVILSGQTIVNKGDMVTPLIYAHLKAFEAAKAKESGQNDYHGLLVLLGQFCFVAMMLAALLYYMSNYEHEIYRSTRNIVFIYMLIAMAVVGGRGLERFLINGVFIVPMAIVPILTLTFFNGRVALLTSIVATLLCSVMTTYSFEFIIMQFVACSAAIYSLGELDRRSQLLRASVFIFAGYVLAYIAVQLMLNGAAIHLSWRMICYLGVNAVLTSMAYIFMALFEKMFGFVSNVTLVELADINNPLLRELSDTCPGTFQHSMAVSNLAADGARAIGANALLTRAGALYHDIGKMSNPVFFTENQHGVNPHDGLSPLKSAQIIINHVTDGLQRAEKAGLPKVIRDFISEHHGKGKAKYFYFTYCSQHPDEQVDAAPFTYPGPNPRTRETSVMMMADAVEAASRSLTEHSAKAIGDLVDKIIDTQVADGLHNESALSFHDVKAIKDAFKKRLMTIYHSRITYPEDPSKKAKQ
jgi:cyclic-di-AMP phosphodiesterase PgpH